MKVFVSWSGDGSREVAELFKRWLQQVIQSCQPWVSTEDIASGSPWFNEINTQLADTSVGILCLTRANKDKPWIMFEAGALTKGLSSSRVCPFLIDIEPSDITPPLSQLNVVTSAKKSVHKLIKDINAMLATPLPEQILESAFNAYWPEFENTLTQIKSTIKAPSDAPVRSDKDIFDEMLTTIRSIDKRLRANESSVGATSNLIRHSLSNVGLTSYRRSPAIVKVTVEEDIIRMTLQLKKNGVDRDTARNMMLNKHPNSAQTIDDVLERHY